MKISPQTFWLSALAVTLAVLAAVASAEPPKRLTIAADEWCPINCSPDGPPLGIGIDLAKAVFEPLGWRVEYVVMPWARALDEVSHGRVDAVVGANSSDDPSLIFPQTSIVTITDDFYVRRADPLTFDGIDSLRGKRLGVIKDYGYEERLQRFIARQKNTPGAVQEVTGEDALAQNIRKLLAGRIDIVVESKPVMDYTLKQMQLADQIRWIGGVPQGNVYLAFSPALPQSKELARLFDEGMARLKQEHKLSVLYEPYGMTP